MRTIVFFARISSSHSLSHLMRVCHFFMTNPRELMEIFLIKWTSSLWCRWKMSFHPFHLSIRDYVISLIDRFFIESHFVCSLFYDWWEPKFVSSNEWSYMTKWELCARCAPALRISSWNDKFELKPIYI